MFVYYDPNPTTCGKRKGNSDCVMRAISKALDVDWLKAYELCSYIAQALYTVPNHVDAYGFVLEHFGFQSQSVPRGTKPTVRQVAQQWKGSKVVCKISGHLVCCVDGDIYDRWDCSEYKVLRYWTKSL